MELQTSDLDADELLHLAIQASQSDRHDQAITYLKRAMAKAPENADIYYFLGAEHAQIGLYERAMEEMAQALELNPALHTARFQLGLLYLTSGRVEPSLQTLQPLEELGEQSYFYWFALGLGHLIRDEFADCKRTLEQGIGLNQANPALNNDMQRILDAMKDKIDAPTDAPVEEAEAGGGNLWLSAYQKDDDETQH
ncbi:tetratricopeptide repeat protein [Paucimonas lemoignei]|uniref:Tetratricopeptide repeat protein n=1 Tax=Paucimonas lemoignei TaxID=29443 RepID=A0A4R3HZN1_PAULE|nr:tetratricopeptide repeat protein [Paucimonas lemoignei]TCS37735.1 tetratricopeptide repeat protein [Paucimonas lemoignei]